MPTSLFNSIRFNPYSIQGIVHRVRVDEVDDHNSRFNPYSIQGIVHPFDISAIFTSSFTLMSPRSVYFLCHITVIFSERPHRLKMRKFHILTCIKNALKT